MLRWFCNGTSLVCLLEPSRRQPCAGPPSPRQASRRIRVGVPTQDQRQRASWEPCNDARFLARAAAATCQQPLVAALDLSTSQLHLLWTSHKERRPSWNDPTPLATETGSQYQPNGNGTSGTTPAQYLSSGEGTPTQHRRSSTDSTYQPPAAPVHDIATPRRQVGEAMPQVGCQHTTDCRQTQNVLLVACAVSISTMVKHVCNNGPTVTPNVPTFMLCVSSLMLRKTRHVKCILRATSDGWQACMHGIRSQRCTVTDKRWALCLLLLTPSEHE